MNNISNSVTVIRIIAAIMLVFTTVFSALFWICYIIGGLSDILDGIAARALNQQCEFGAKLDSIADFIFGAAIAFVVVRSIHFPLWLWICIVCIAALRFMGYGIGFYKYHAFYSLHTYANKLTGALLFAFPIIYCFLNFNIAEIIVCTVAFASAIEEVIIIVLSKELNRNCKGFWDKKYYLYMGE